MARFQLDAAVLNELEQYIQINGGKNKVVTLKAYDKHDKYHRITFTTKTWCRLLITCNANFWSMFIHGYNVRKSYSLNNNETFNSFIEDELYVMKSPSDDDKSHYLMTLLQNLFSSGSMTKAAK